MVEDFKYLGSWMQSSMKDIKTRKAQAWIACHKLSKIWKANLTRTDKIKLFQATVESVLLYGSETWTITSKIRKMLDGCYTRLLRTALNVSWKAHMTNQDLYGLWRPPQSKREDQEKTPPVRWSLHEENWSSNYRCIVVETSAWEKKCRKTNYNLCESAMPGYWTNTS